jgi:AcrR family transcriptional regulator
MTDNDMLRSKPKQERSLKRFNHILDTAAVLYETHGFDAVTTNHIAAAANVSIGSLYRFFPNKDVILEALIDRYREDMQAIFPQGIEPPRPIAEILDEMFAKLAQFEATHTGFQSIFLNVEAAATKEQMLRADTVVWVEGLLAAQFPQLTPSRRRIAAEVGVGIVKGLLPLMESPFTYPPDVIMREVREAVLAYLDAFLHREGIRQQDDE